MALMRPCDKNDLHVNDERTKLTNDRSDGDGGLSVRNDSLVYQIGASILSCSPCLPQSFSLMSNSDQGQADETMCASTIYAFCYTTATIGQVRLYKGN